MIESTFKNTYKETIINGRIYREWNIKFNVSTGRVEDCIEEIDEMEFCSKKPDDRDTQCTSPNDVSIVSKPGACEAKILYNNSLQYYVQFPRIDVHDQIQEFLLKNIQGKCSG